MAILLVLGRHWPLEVRVLDPPLRQLAAVWQCGGYLGVDLFFVLSGFLVAGLLLREQARHGSLQVGRFLLRRGFKIYPAFYLLLLVSLLSGLSDLPPTRERLLAEALYLQNYLGGCWNHTWSLAVEEHFYLLLPVTLLFLRRPADPARGPGSPGFRGILPLFLAVGGGCLALRLSLPPSPAEGWGHLSATHLRLDGLTFGVLLAWLHHERPGLFGGLSLPARWALGLFGLLLLLPAFVWDLARHPWLSTSGLTLFYLGGGALLVALLPARLSSRPARALGLVGRHSYSIYLWHMLMTRLAAMACLTWPELLPPWGWLALYLGGTLLVGVTLSLALEAPLLRLRDRLVPSRSGALVVRAD